MRQRTSMGLAECASRTLPRMLLPRAIIVFIIAVLAVISARVPRADEAPVVLATSVERLGSACTAEFTSFQLSPDGRHVSWVSIDNSSDTQTMVIDGVAGEAWKEIGTLQTTPDWRHYIYVAFDDQGQSHWIHDGRQLTGYVEPDFMTLADSGELAFRVRHGDGHAMVFGGHPGPTYPKAWCPRISADGRTFAYAIQTSEGQYGTVVNGRPQMVDGHLVTFQMSSDGRRMAFEMERDRQAYVVVDGQESRLYDAVHRMEFCPMSKRFVYGVTDEGELHVVVDGDNGPTFDCGERGFITEMIFTADGRRLAYQVHVAGDKRRVVVDDKAGPEFDDIVDFMYTADGAHFIYQGIVGEIGLSAEYVLIVNHRQETVSQVPLEPVLVGPEGGHYAYVVTSPDGRQQAVIDGRTGESYDAVESLAFSRDGEHVAYLARSGNRSLVVVDGHEVQESEEQRYTTPSLNRHGDRMAYVVWDDNAGTSAAVIDGLTGPKFNAVLRPVFDADGSVEYLAYDGDQLVRVKHAFPGDPALVAQDSPPVAGQTTRWVVARDGSGDVTTIAEAIERAAAGDEVHIHTGVYHESVAIDKAIRMLGAGPRDRIVIQSAEADCVLVKSGPVHIQGLTLRCRAGGEEEFFALDIAGGEVTVNDCDLSSNSLACIGIHGRNAQAAVRNCWVRDSSDAGIILYEHSCGTIEDCEIFDNLDAGVAVQTRASAKLRGCRIHHNQAEGVAITQRGAAEIEDCHIFANGGPPLYADPRSLSRVKTSRLVGQLLPAESIRSNIDDNDESVDPQLDELVLSFNTAMDTASWYLGEADREYGEFPELRGEKAAYFRDPRTFVIEVALAPDRSYALCLNAPGHMDFQTSEGLPLEQAMIWFHTAPKAGTESTPEPSGFETGLQVLTFLERPTQEHFLEARRAVIESDDYRAARGNELGQIADLLEQNRNKEAKTLIEDLLPKLYLSPRVHLLASEAISRLSCERDARMGDNSAQKELQYSRHCLSAIHASGNGSRENPFLVLRPEDEIDLCIAFDKKAVRRLSEQHQGRTLDAVVCEDGSMIWFDASSFANRESLTTER